MVDARLSVRQPFGHAYPVDSEVNVAAPNMPSGAGSFGWVPADSSYMRELAHRCTRAARECPHLPTSHELEAIGVELMEKAKELDELNQTSGSDDAPRKASSRPKVPKK
jgi:hypothetical protein